MEPDDVERLLQKMSAHLKSTGEKADLARIKEIIYACEPQSLEEAFECLRFASQEHASVESNKITRPIPRVELGGIHTSGEARRPAKLTATQKKELIGKLKQGDKESETLIATYVLEKGRRIAARFGNNPEDIDDFVQGAFIEVRKALKNCDERKVRDLDAYIESVISFSMRSQFSGRQGRLDLTRYDRDNIKKLEKCQTRLQRTLGREPTLKELSQVSALSEDKVREYQQISSQGFVVSLDQTLSDDEMHSIVDDLSYEEDQDMAIELARMPSWLDPLFSKLSKDEQTVLRLRFRSEPALSLAEIGTRMGVTKQWVQQVQNCALRKLRAGAEEVRVNRVPIHQNQRKFQDQNQILEKVSPPTDWLAERILSKARSAKSRVTQDELVLLVDRGLKRGILLYEEGSDSVEPLPYDEVLHWLVGHLLAAGRLVKIPDSSYIAITPAGLSWLESHKVHH